MICTYLIDELTKEWHKVRSKVPLNMSNGLLGWAGSVTGIAIKIELFHLSLNP